MSATSMDPARSSKLGKLCVPCEILNNLATSPAERFADVGVSMRRCSAHRVGKQRALAVWVSGLWSDTAFPCAQNARDNLCALEDRIGIAPLIHDGSGDNVWTR